MPYRRVLLRDDHGAPVASLAVGGLPPRVALPDGVSALRCLAGEIYPVAGSSFLLPTGEDDFSLIVRRGEEILFASTLTGEEASYAKWRLLSSPGKGARREEIPPQREEENLREEREEETPAESIPAEIERENAAPHSLARERAERLLESGTPFPLFERMMSGSRWALVHEDGAEFLVGITEEGRVLVGIPGTRDYPPDEETLWSYFPTEEEETGYYLTEYSE